MAPDNNLLKPLGTGKKILTEEEVLADIAAVKAQEPKKTPAEPEKPAAPRKRSAKSKWPMPNPILKPLSSPSLPYLLPEKNPYTDILSKYKPKFPIYEPFKPPTKKDEDLAEAVKKILESYKKPKNKYDPMKNLIVPSTTSKIMKKSFNYLEFMKKHEKYKIK